MVASAAIACIVLQQLQLCLILLLLLLLLVMVTAQCAAVGTASLIAHVHVLVAPPAARGRHQLQALRIGVGNGEPAEVLRAQILPKLPTLGLGTHQRNAITLLEGQLILPGWHIRVQRLHQWTLIATLEFTMWRLLLNDLMFAACKISINSIMLNLCGMHIFLTCQRGIASQGQIEVGLGTRQGVLCIVR